MIPQKIGRYEIKGELGRGGMANVYRGYDPRFKREVAVKLLPHEFLRDPNFRARFEREAEVIAALEHPAIVPVYDYGEEDGQPYLVMRLMTGGSLAERLERGPLSLTETARIFSRLAPALDRAHARGIIHRDLKPGNILFDDDENPYISDFGIAKLTEGGSTFTGSGVVGTPAYMSPEQARGEKHIDGRSDIYALGAIVFQMLTGKFPYEADTPMGIIVKHITDPVPHILDANAELPSGCEDLIQKAMAKKPADRFPKAVDMSGTLDSIATGTYAPAVVPPTLQVDRATVDAATRVVQQAQDAKKVEQERIARERAEAEAKAGQERIARERAEAERLARERVEREEAERIAKEATVAAPERTAREKVETGPAPVRQPTVQAAAPQTIAVPKPAEAGAKAPAAKPRSTTSAIVGLIVVGVIILAVVAGVVGVGVMKSTTNAQRTQTAAALANSATQSKPPTQAPTSTRPPKPTEAPAHIGPSTVSGPLTIWYAYGPGSGEEQALKELIARAGKNYPEAKIEAAQFDLGALFEKYQISVKAGEGPDLMVAPNDDLGNWARGGYVLDITGFLKGQLEGVNPVAVDGMMVDGRLYGVPESSKAVGLYFNRDFIPKPPRSTVELLEMVSVGRTLVVPLSAYHLFGFFGAFGGQLMDEHGKCIADQGGYVEAMQYLLKLKAAGAVFDPDYGNIQSMFRNGKAAMSIDGPWSLPEYRGALGDRLGVAPIPGGPGGPARPLTGIDGFYVNPESKNPESAIALALFLTTPDSMQVFAETAGHIPIRPDIPVKDSLLVAFGEASLLGLPRPQSPEFANYWGPFGEMVVDVMNGPVSPEEGVKRACDKMNAANGK